MSSSGAKSGGASTGSRSPVIPSSTMSTTTGRSPVGRRPSRPRWRRPSTPAPRAAGSARRVGSPPRARRRSLPAPPPSMPARRSRSELGSAGGSLGSITSACGPSWVPSGCAPEPTTCEATVVVSRAHWGRRRVEAGRATPGADGGERLATRSWRCPAGCSPPLGAVGVREPVGADLPVPLGTSGAGGQVVAATARSRCTLRAPGLRPAGRRGAGTQQPSRSRREQGGREPRCAGASARRPPCPPWWACRRSIGPSTASACCGSSGTRRRHWLRARLQPQPQVPDPLRRHGQGPGLGGGARRRSGPARRSRPRRRARRRRGGGGRRAAACASP